MVELHKYSGAGNDFVVLDGRSEDVSEFRTPERISALCDRETGFVPSFGRAADAGRRAWEPSFPGHGKCARENLGCPGSTTPALTSAARPGADGLMILTDDPDYDFRMEYYNSDGSGGMMCGNGGRCIVAFADALGLTPADGSGVFRFVAADGPHTGEILSRAGDCKTVRLRMTDVRTFHRELDGWFLDTGTRHFVRFVPDADAVDVEEEGRRARWDPVFAPVGANANFVSVDPDGTLRVRTFEKGVEAETLACGTGITAAAVAAALEYGGISPEPPAAINPFPTLLAQSPGAGRSADADFAALKAGGGIHIPLPHASAASEPIRYSIQARIARLEVEFRVGRDCFTDVYLTGPADEVR